MIKIQFKNSKIIGPIDSIARKTFAMNVAGPGLLFTNRNTEAEVQAQKQKYARSS